MAGSRRCALAAFRYGLLTAMAPPYITAAGSSALADDEDNDVVGRDGSQAATKEGVGRLNGAGSVLGVFIAVFFAAIVMELVGRKRRRRKRVVEHERRSKDLAQRSAHLRFLVEQN